MKSKVFEEFCLKFRILFYIYFIDNFSTNVHIFLPLSEATVQGCS